MVDALGDLFPEEDSGVSRRAKRGYRQISVPEQEFDGPRVLDRRIPSSPEAGEEQETLQDAIDRQRARDRGADIRVRSFSEDAGDGDVDDDDDDSTIIFRRPSSPRGASASFSHVGIPAHPYELPMPIPAVQNILAPPGQPQQQPRQSLSQNDIFQIEERLRDNPMFRFAARVAGRLGQRSVDLLLDQTLLSRARDIAKQERSAKLLERDQAQKALETAEKRYAEASDTYGKVSNNARVSLTTYMPEIRGLLPANDYRLLARYVVDVGNGPERLTSDERDMASAKLNAVIESMSAASRRAIAAAKDGRYDSALLTEVERLTALIMPPSTYIVPASRDKPARIAFPWKDSEGLPARLFVPLGLRNAAMTIGTTPGGAQVVDANKLPGQPENAPASALPVAGAAEQLWATYGLAAAEAKRDGIETALRQIRALVSTAAASFFGTGNAESDGFLSRIVISNVQRFDPDDARRRAQKTDQLLADLSQASGTSPPSGANQPPGLRDIYSSRLGNLVTRDNREQTRNFLQELVYNHSIAALSGRLLRWRDNTEALYAVNSSFYATHKSIIHALALAFPWDTANLPALDAVAAAGDLWDAAAENDIRVAILRLYLQYELVRGYVSELVDQLIFAVEGVALGTAAAESARAALKERYASAAVVNFANSRPYGQEYWQYPDVSGRMLYSAALASAIAAAADTVRRQGSGFREYNFDVNDHVIAYGEVTRPPPGDPGLAFCELFLDFVAWHYRDTVKTGTYRTHIVAVDSSIQLRNLFARLATFQMTARGVKYAVEYNGDKEGKRPY
jgi:hypothetical protein